MFISDIAIFYLIAQKNERLKSASVDRLYDDIGMTLL